LRERNEQDASQDDNADEARTGESIAFCAGEPRWDFDHFLEGCDATAVSRTMVKR
jgi:hypothetical protein